jgi:predicted dehydrogenase
MMSGLRIGLLGCGPRGCTLVHTIGPIKGVDITALCDRFETRIGEAASLLDDDSSCKRYTDHRQMLREAPIDAVYVVVEPENCSDLVVECLEAAKHVISDVPMSFTMEGIWNIIAAVERTGMKYMLGESTRYWPFINEWKRMVEDGLLGKIINVEGQYLHGMTLNRYYQHPETGARITLEEAAQLPNPLKSRTWNQPHPILYLPHELSPLLRAMDDRVTSVVCMGTSGPSYVHDFFPNPDIETALMKTQKGSLMRLSAGFTAHQPRKEITMYHWYSMMGTKGSVETHRTDHDKMKLVLVEDDKAVSREVWYDFDRQNTAAEILNSGHSGLDYYAVRYFADAVLGDSTPKMDVYRAAESAAPAILAAQSAEQNSQLLEIPDFRPGPHRPAGQLPATVAAVG